MTKPDVFIITGNREGGKTGYLEDMVDFLSVFDIRLSGFLSKGVFTSDGQKDFMLKSLVDKKEVHLASRKHRENYYKAGRFFFNPDAILLGEKIIESSISQKTDLLIIDEIGPIELSEKIWFKSLTEAFDKLSGVVVISVRMRLLDAVREKFQIYEAFVHDITVSSPRVTGESILSLLKSRDSAPAI
jgi:nucleoside-triphosphatase THEP1